MHLLVLIFSLMYKSLKQGYLFTELIYYMLRLSNIFLTGSVPQGNTSNHAPYFSILILFNHECFVYLSMSFVALRAYALNKITRNDERDVSPATLT